MSLWSNFKFTSQLNPLYFPSNQLQLESPLRSNGRQTQKPKKTLNICLISYRSSPYSGGQGVYVKFLARELARLGHNVDVISGPPYPDLQGTDTTLIKLPGLNLYESKNLFREFSLDFLKSPVELFEWFSIATGGFPEPYTFGERVAEYISMNQEKYDIVHDNQSLSYGLLRIRNLGIPTIATIHHPITVDRNAALRETNNTLETFLIKRWYHFLKMQKSVARRLPHLKAVSESSKNSAAKDFGLNEDTISVIHNGIDTDQFRPKPDIKTQDYRIMSTASSDMPVKGLEYLLKAIYQIKPKYPKLELVVVGELQEEGKTEKLLRNLDLKDTVNFFHEISFEKMVKLYSSSAIAIVPSLYEGFGFPAGEAMACEVPLISTTGGALEEVVGDAGILVPPGKSVPLANAIINLLENPKKQKRLAKKGRKRIKSEFTWKSTAQNTIKLYNRVIAHENNRPHTT